MKKLLWIFLPFAFTGCIKKAADKIDKLHGAKWTGTYAAPILNADLALNDAVELVGSLAGVNTYADGLIYLEFATSEISKSGNQLVPLQNQSHNFTDVLSLGEANSLTGSNNVTLTRNFSFNYTSPGVEIDSVAYANGELNISFNNNYAHAGNAVITIPQLKLNGAPAKFTFSFSANQQNISKYFNLIGYKFNLSSGGLGYSYLPGKIDISYTNSGNGFTGSNNFQVDIDLKNQQFNRVYGYFGDNLNLITAADSLELQIFSANLKTGSYNFADPRFKFRVTNETGFPLLFRTFGLSGSANGTSTNITGYPATKSFPALALNNIGKSITDSILLDKNNSNFKVVIDKKPKMINYDFTVTGNSGGKTQRNFLTAESKVTVKVITELPFWGTAVDLVLNDTSDFNLGLGNEIDLIEWIVLRMNIDNGIPTTIGIQGYFMDSNNVILDSLFKPYRNFINGAIVDATGTVISTSIEQYDITMDRLKIEKIKTAKKLWIKAYVNTSKNAGSSVPVKITNLQHLKLKMGIHSKLSIHEKF